ncbi:DUF721 domain-containing protein [Candidatus Poriferisodalis sp.]|uniref:DUF721 domain-containing protein n=1 Tax=Candidatus Poriferisodalis sp. TaxID=3101277 RepID=UPI003B013201
MSSRRRGPDQSGPRPISDSLKAVAAGFGSRGRALDLHRRWAAAVGETIAAHSRPERLESGRLTVVVDDPAWATELRYHSARILSALNADDLTASAGVGSRAGAADATAICHLRLRVDANMRLDAGEQR